MPNVLRNLPSVNELLDSPPLKSLVRRVSRNVVVTRVGQFLDGLRGQVQSAATGMNIPTPSELAQRIADWIAEEEQPAVRPVINATGILLHPELGGPPLADEAIQAAAAIAGSYASLDLDLTTGQAASRTAAAERLLVKLTGAEAATVVNNHAGAAVLALAALASGREVIVSRGQLVEIPGSHRLPDVIAASGAVLREVGTTNSTRAADYAAAIGPRTAAVLHVHTAGALNSGSAEHAPLAELTALAQRHKLPLIDDLGNGSLIDMSGYGIAGELTAESSVNAGADLVLVSGERLLGGPQCGLIVGRRSFVQQLVQHPLLAAVRVNKLTLAALVATLRLYRDASLVDRCVPLLSLLATPLDNLKNRAERLGPQIAAGEVVRVEVVPDEARAVSGISNPQALATCCLSLVPVTGTAQSLAAALRMGAVPVIGRVQGDRLLLDLRTVLPRQDIELVAAFDALAAPKAPAPRGEEIPTVD